MPGRARGNAKGHGWMRSRERERERHRPASTYFPRYLLGGRRKTPVRAEDGRADELTNAREKQTVREVS